MRYPVSPLLTDLYQLTMMQAYHDAGMNENATFEFFFRKLPHQRKFLVSCGLSQVIEFLETLCFSREDIEFLRNTGTFHPDFLQQLSSLRFTGSVHALAEGSIFFSNEPLVRVTAPLPLAQLVETRIINILQYQTMVATKALAIRRTLPKKILVDYGLRRSHGAEAGLMAARASYIAGFDGTATVLAGELYGVPLYGTMAHSFIQAHDSEEQAFLNFATSHPENCVLLLDTFDTLSAAQKVVQLAEIFRGKNIQLRGVRLDSGDMITLSKKVRNILDDGGLHEVKIFASGSLDEYELEKFSAEDAPIDGYGIGTKLTTCADTPYYDCAYKLVEYNGRGRRKLSTSKITWPGKKQLYRIYDNSGRMAGDSLALAGEQLPGAPLVEQFMDDGERCRPLPSLAEIRDHLTTQLITLPPDDQLGENYPVIPSPALKKYSDQVTERMLASNRSSQI